MASDMAQRDADLVLLQEKWHYWFHWLDINQDGSLTSEDWSLGAETMIKEHGMDEKQAEVARASYQRIGQLLLGGQDQQSVKENSFVQNLTSFYQENRLKAQEYIFNVMRQLFLVADVNRDAMISEKEFVILMKSFGIKSENAQQFYHQLTQWQRGKVPLQEAINWWVNVWFGTDKEQWENVKKMHEEHSN